jgi:hypothetical protein
MTATSRRSTSYGGHRRRDDAKEEKWDKQLIFNAWACVSRHSSVAMAEGIPKVLFCISKKKRSVKRDLPLRVFASLRSKTDPHRPHDSAHQLVLHSLGGAWMISPIPHPGFTFL